MTVSTTTVAVHVSGLNRTFDGRPVLQGLDLTIGTDEFVAMIGRSGSGKSTLLRILAGLDTGYDGDVLVPAERSVVFQEARLIPWRRAAANVVLGLAGRTPELYARALDALAEVGLGDRARDWPVTLSGGEAQRVALARALVREPRLLLLDEPFGALDALTRSSMQLLVRTICRRHRPGVLLVTHDVDEAILLADRVLVLRDGRIGLDISLRAGRPDRGEVGYSVLRDRLLASL